MSKDKEKYRQRNDIRLVNNDQFNDRFFKTCQHVKDPRYMEQKIHIIAWKAYRRGGLVDMKEESQVDITGLVMMANEPPSFSEYIAAINTQDKQSLNDDGGLTVMLTMEITYMYRGK